MMFEDILAYRSCSRLTDSFSELLTADLEDDAQLFYLRMAADVAAVTTAVGRAADRVRITRHLLAALLGRAPATGASWQQLYREIDNLVAADFPESVPEFLHGDLIGALGRLQQFLAENLDLAEPLAARALYEHGAFA